MTDVKKENDEIKTNGHCVQNAIAVAETHDSSHENAPAALGKNFFGGVGVSDLSASTGVAICSDGLSEKKSNAYGVRKTPAACAVAVKQKSSVCDSAQVSKSEAKA